MFNTFNVENERTTVAPIIGDIAVVAAKPLELFTFVSRTVLELYHRLEKQHASIQTAVEIASSKASQALASCKDNANSLKNLRIPSPAKVNASLLQPPSVGSWATVAGILLPTTVHSDTGST
ncbi:hypothetical protein RUND412_008176, partial [Rhizina undulata]